MNPSGRVILNCQEPIFFINFLQGMLDVPVVRSALAAISNM